MFKKNHKVRIESAWAMDLVKVLGKYGVKFEVTDEFQLVGNVDGRKIWHRDFTIRARKRTYDKILNEFYENTSVNQ